MTSTQKLLEEVEAFLAHTGMTASAFGLLIRNDSRLVATLRKGTSVTLETADRIREFMRGYRPTKPRRQREAA